MDTDTEFAGRVALVMGGSPGIGQTGCVDLARRGAQIVMNDAENEAAAAEASEKVKAAGATCLPTRPVRGIRRMSPLG